MLDWMLNTRRRFGAERTVQDRSCSAANGDWRTRTRVGQVRASSLEDGTSSRGQLRRTTTDWNTGWHRTVHDFDRK